MAARAKYPATHEQLFALAEQARLAGVPFEEWWEEAVRPGQPAVTWNTPEPLRPYGAVVWSNDTGDRNLSIAVTLGAREGWRRAYNRLPPSRGEEALKRLRPVLEVLTDVPPATGKELSASAA